MITVGKFLLVHVEEKIVQLNKKILIANFIIVFCFLLDRITKVYILNLFTEDVVKEYYINQYINFVLLWNKGIAFGLFQSDDIFYNLITILISLIIIYIFYLIFRSKNKFEMICFSMITGGAIGNFIDRIYYKAVPDFIDLHYKDFHWFTFNVSDICITIGIILFLIFDMFKIKIKDNE